jgi:hypothetical protein
MVPSVATSLKDAENAFRRDDFDAVIIDAREINGRVLPLEGPQGCSDRPEPKRAPCASAQHISPPPDSLTRPIEPYAFHVLMHEYIHTQGGLDIRGYEVLAISSSEEAIRLSRDLKPDLVAQGDFPWSGHGWHRGRYTLRPYSQWMVKSLLITDFFHQIDEINGINQQVKLTE